MIYMVERLNSKINLIISLLFFFVLLINTTLQLQLFLRELIRKYNNYPEYIFYH